MYIRCAFFKGRVKAGHQAEFDTHVDTVLLDTWRAFPGAQEVRVLREVESDEPDVHFELVVAIRFESREAIAAALASPQRADSRQKSQFIINRFEGEIFHTVFKASELPLLS